MNSIRGFHCSECHSELLAGRTSGGVPIAPHQRLPILCCGRPLHALKADEIMIAVLRQRRVARCRRCGYAIDLVVHPAGPLVCIPCRMEFDIDAEQSDSDDAGV